MANESSQDKMKQETRAKLKRNSSNISCHSWEEAVKIMVDTGSTSSYVCTDLMTKLGIKPVRREQRCIEQMYGTMKKTVEVYNRAIKSSVIEGFQLKVHDINAEKNVLTFRTQKSLESRTKSQESEVYAF